MNSSYEIFSLIEDEELYRLEQEAEQTGSASTTNRAMDKFQNCLPRRNIRCDWRNVEKQELGNILHQSCGEQKNTNNSMASPSTPNGAPFRNCDIMMHMTYNTPRQWSHPVWQSPYHGVKDFLPRFSCPVCTIRDRKIVMRCSWFVFAVKCMWNTHLHWKFVNFPSPKYHARFPFSFPPKGDHFPTHNGLDRYPKTRKKTFK